MSHLLKTKLLIYNTIRNICKRPRIYYNEGIQYPGFKYYPRHKDFKDPPYEPSKLFRVQRIKPIKGRPYWEKNILKQYRLDGKPSEIAVIKNTPTNNAALWKIKHLIKIDPITFPNGFPQSTDGTLLKENGELVVAHQLKPVETKLIASTKFEEQSTKLDGDTLRRESRMRWLNPWS